MAGGVKIPCVRRRMSLTGCPAFVPRGVDITKRTPWPVFCLLKIGPLVGILTLPTWVVKGGGGGFWGDEAPCHFYCSQDGAIMGTTEKYTGKANVVLPGVKLS